MYYCKQHSFTASPIKNHTTPIGAFIIAIGHSRYLHVSQVVHVTHMFRLHDADTTGGHGDADTPSPRGRYRNRKPPRDIPRALLRLPPLRRRTASDGRGALWDTRWPRLLPGTLLRASAGAETTPRRRVGSTSDHDDVDSSSDWNERSTEESADSSSNTRESQSQTS